MSKGNLPQFESIDNTTELKRYFQSSLNLEKHLDFAYRNIVKKESFNTIARKEGITPQRVNDMVKLYRLKIYPRILELKGKAN